MPYQVIGLGTDHTQDTNISIRNFVQTNWSLTGELDDLKILFGVGWLESQRDVEIHFKKSSPPAIEHYSLGSDGLDKFDDIIYVHTWITNQSPNSEPPNYDNVGKVYRELERIIQENPKGLATTQGIMWMRFVRPMYTVPEEDPTQTTFHGIGIIVLMYVKANRP